MQKSDDNLIVRNDEILLDDEALMKETELSFYKSTGSGGQKKNKTSSAARVLHRPTKIEATAGERRSQRENRIAATRRLKWALAFVLRKSPAPPWTEGFNLNEKNPRFPLLLATVVDHLEEQNYQVSEAAKGLGITTGALNKFMKKFPQLWQFVNQERQKRNLKSLK